MKEKKVSSFQFKKISRESLGNKTPTDKQKSEAPITPKKVNKETTPVIRSDRELLQTLGDKEKLDSIDEKLTVIDYVFKKHDHPIVICNACGTKIGSKYYTSHSKDKDIIFCSGCYQSLTNCHNCGMPGKKTGIKLPGTYCSFCRITKECHCCGTKITSKDSYRIPYVKGNYCHNCYHQSERCVVCCTPIESYKDIFIAGKKICPSCSKRKITEKEANRLNSEVIHYINNRFGVKEKIRCDVHLTNYNNINPAGQLEKLGRFMKVSGKSILVLYEGITRERALGVFAYEYGDFLIKRLNPKIQDKQVINSFSLWLKSFILRENGEIDEPAEITGSIKDFPILRTLSNIERLGGINRVIERIKTGELKPK